MAKDPIKKAENGTYYFRANLGFHPITGKQIQKYKSGFKTKKEAREAYSKLMLTSTECKLRSNGMPVPLLRNGYSIFNGTKYR